jgi:hypothetical protein
VPAILPAQAQRPHVLRLDSLSGKEMSALSHVGFSLHCVFMYQVGYAFKDEVALVEVAHKHNEDLPAVRVTALSSCSLCGSLSVWIVCLAACTHSLSVDGCNCHCMHQLCHLLTLHGVCCSCS